MEHIDQSQRINMYAPKSSSFALRWMMTITLTVCGLLIVAVLLSQPRAMAYVQGGFDRVETIVASFMSDKTQPNIQTAQIGAAQIGAADASAPKPTPVAAPIAPPKPVVMSMPTSRVPVRRLGFSVED
ncbi:MAG: hypothetical protein ACI92Z_002020 [Paracoccaceae bacterium]|jgi:hypothetical protein